MEFELAKATEIIERTPQVLKALLFNLSIEWTNSNEGEDTWSPYDIIGHFIHGEKTDWIERANIILSSRENKTFVPFDTFAQFENSKGKSLNDLLDEFEKLRTENLRALKEFNFSDDQLKLEGIHPEFGAVNNQAITFLPGPCTTSDT